MEPILFFAKELKFYFGEDSKLLIYDTSHLPYSKKLLSSIRSKIPFFTLVVGYPPEGTMLLLNKDNYVFTFPIYKIFARCCQEVEFLSSYNHNISHMKLDVFYETRNYLRVLIEDNHGGFGMSPKFRRERNLVHS